MESASTTNMCKQQPLKKQIQISQQHIDNLVDKLNLSQENAEKLENELKIWLEPGVKAKGLYNDPKDQFRQFFEANDDNTMVYCNNIGKIMQAMDVSEYKALDWRLFIDSSENNIKMALLNNDNRKPLIPIAYQKTVARIGEDMHLCDKMKSLLQIIEYDKHQWKMSCDLETVGVLFGRRKFSGRHCFLCWWNGGGYYQSPYESEVDKLSDKVMKNAFVSEESIQMSPLYIKLALVESFIKVVAKRPEVFDGLQNIYPNFDKEQLKQGV